MLSLASYCEPCNLDAMVGFLINKLTATCIILINNVNWIKNVFGSVLNDLTETESVKKKQFFYY